VLSYSTARARPPEGGHYALYSGAMAMGEARQRWLAQLFGELGERLDRVIQMFERHLRDDHGYGPS
jgi:hypothetical protein